MGAHLVRYSALERGICEACGLPPTRLNPAVRCTRCEAHLCRRCYSRSCTCALASVVFSFPLVLGGNSVCEVCKPEAAREEAFRTGLEPFLARGEVFCKLPLSRSVFSGFGDQQDEAIMLRLDVARRSLEWQSMQLIRNVPKHTGSVELSSVRDVLDSQVPDRSASAAPGHCIRLVDAAGAALLILTTVDERQQRRWLAGIVEAAALAKMPHSRVFASSSAGASSATASGGEEAPGGGGGKVGGGGGMSLVEAKATQARQAKAARQREMEERQLARDAFKARLGDVGMSHTAAALLGRGAPAADALHATAAAAGDGAGRVTRGDRAGSVGAAAGAGAGVASHSGSPAAAAASERRGSSEGVVTAASAAATSAASTALPPARTRASAAASQLLSSVAGSLRNASQSAWIALAPVGTGAPSRGPSSASSGGGPAARGGGAAFSGALADLASNRPPSSAPIGAGGSSAVGTTILGGIGRSLRSGISGLARDIVQG